MAAGKIPEEGGNYNNNTTLIETFLILSILPELCHLILNSL